MSNDAAEVFENFDNVFDEPVNFSDVASAFEFLDVGGEKRITLKRFKTIFPHLGVEGDASEMFHLLDRKHSRGVTLSDFQDILRDPPDDLIDLLQKLLSGFVYEPEYESPTGEMEMEKIKAMLIDKNRKPDWRDRVDAMRSFARQSIRSNNREQFIKRFKRFAGYFIIQLQDRRTIVFRTACEAIAKIVLRKGRQCIKSAPRLLQAMFDYGVRGKVQIAADSAAQVCLAIVKHIPDNSKFVILDTLIKNAKEQKYEFQRTACFALISLLLAQVYINKGTKSDAWYKKIFGLLKTGIKDSDKTVRTNAYSCLVTMEALKPELANTLTSKFKKTQKNTYSHVKENFNPSDPDLQLTRQISLAAGRQAGDESVKKITPIKIESAPNEVTHKKNVDLSRSSCGLASFVDATFQQRA